MVTEIPPALNASRLDRMVRTRRSIRSFREDEIPREVVAGLLRDAVWAPSPHNSQPWRFTVLFEPADKGRLARLMAEQLAAELHADGIERDTIDRQTRRSTERISRAPVVILCSLVSDGLVPFADARRNRLEWEMAVQSVGAVLQSLFLLAAARGIGSCWMAAPMYCPGVVRTALDLRADFVPQALVLLGYPAQPGRVRERRSFAEVVDLR